ncbi:SET domain-containing protein [Pleurotus eryngii]|uniref:SET domain-containing protein n=1 Tax=Pleurotus eryngii TaxID=5323 RepID=A0A9P6A0A0_PLEER|nr:SET domain-containing protein [Pleurotus eryngii]
MSGSRKELWRRSESPTEVWDDTDKEWEFEIVGEELDEDGKTSRYEVRWLNWHRSDGTNVTWPGQKDPIPVRAIKAWKQEQATRIQKILKDSPSSLAIKVPTTLDGHLMETDLRSQGYQQKLAIRRMEPSQAPNKLVEHMHGLLSKKVHPITQQPRQSRLQASQARTSTSQTSTSQARSSTASSKAGPSKQPASQERRLKLEKEWTAIADTSHAAPIAIVNIIDDEDGPPLPPNFRYVEQGYIYHKDVEEIDLDAVMVGCDCYECDHEGASACDCQAPSRLHNRNDKIFAYTPDGLFNFQVASGIEVIECNKKCECNPDCVNRVAQRPRKFVIEVFKTSLAGWGVRSQSNIKRGQVVGVYSGQLITRKQAEEMPLKHRGYCFDLDGYEDPDGNASDSDRQFTVDSRQHGNWTRFINHSCSPNMVVYSVVYDTIPEFGNPYLAFAALRDIPNLTELTFDYDPSEGDRAKKGKDKMPPGARKCHCGTEGCRGWVPV